MKKKGMKRVFIYYRKFIVDKGLTLGSARDLHPGDLMSLTHILTHIRALFLFKDDY